MRRVAKHLHLPTGPATEILGTALARAMPNAREFGAVIYLQGELGAGKTTCARSFLRTLGVSRPVRSPTYTLVETYAVGGLACVHVDLYRLGGDADAEGLGLRDWAGPGCVLLVEWPERGGDAIPRPDLELRLEYEEEGRRASLASCSVSGERWLEKLAGDTSLIPYVSNIT